MADASRIVAPPAVTTEDAPVVLSLDMPAGSAPRHMLGVDGVSFASVRDTLPGIRVGEGDGNGYVLVRELDGQLVFVPDQGFVGTTRFVCTTAEPDGQQASVLFTVQVEANSATANEEITFTNGLRQASVPEGTEAAIIGALSIADYTQAQLPDVRVYEQSSAAPSSRFVVSAGRLQAVQPLDHVTDGTIHLRIDAYEDSFVFASSEFSIEVLPAISPSLAAMTASAPRLALAYSADGSIEARDGAGDTFIFAAGRGDEQETSADQHAADALDLLAASEERLAQEQSSGDVVAADAGMAADGAVADAGAIAADAPDGIGL